MHKKIFTPADYFILRILFNLMFSISTLFIKRPTMITNKRLLWAFCALGIFLASCQKERVTTDEFSTIQSPAPVFNSINRSATNFPETFETGSKGAYAAADVTLCNRFLEPGGSVDRVNDQRSKKRNEICQDPKQRNRYNEF